MSRARDEKGRWLATGPAPGECGTYGGYQAHRKRGEDACGPCETANNEYMRDYRQRSPRSRDVQVRRQGTRYRALTRLARLHPEEFERLLAEETLRQIGGAA